MNTELRKKRTKGNCKKGRDRKSGSHFHFVWFSSETKNCKWKNRRRSANDQIIDMHHVIISPFWGDANDLKKLCKRLAWRFIDVERKVTMKFLIHFETLQILLDLESTFQISINKWQTIQLSSFLITKCWWPIRFIFLWTYQFWKPYNITQHNNNRKWHKKQTQNCWNLL